MQRILSWDTDIYEKYTINIYILKKLAQVQDLDFCRQGR